MERWSGSDVLHWLYSEDLGDYESIFMRNNITGLELKRLTEKRMKEMGIIKIGHRKKITVAIRRTLKHEKLPSGMEDLLKLERAQSVELLQVADHIQQLLVQTIATQKAQRKEYLNKMLHQHPQLFGLDPPPIYESDGELADSSDGAVGAQGAGGAGGAIADDSRGGSRIIACPRCTFHNPAAAPLCEICQEPLGGEGGFESDGDEEGDDLRRFEGPPPLYNVAYGIDAGQFDLLDEPTAEMDISDHEGGSDNDIEA